MESPGEVKVSPTPWPPPHSVERGKSSVGALLAAPWVGHRPTPTKQILRSLTKVQGT